MKQNKGFETTEVAGKFNTLQEAIDWMTARGWTGNGLGEFRHPEFAGWVRSVRNNGLRGFTVVQDVPVAE